ncbi:MAG: NAD(P)-dependent oxidoreductase [Alphaproteobacteria bacterium]
MNDTPHPRIGFIGLGLMGSAMVERLQSVDAQLTVIAHRNRAPIETAVGRGAKEAATAGELAAASDVVMLCVDTTAAVEANMNGPDGIIANLRPGSLVIDFGTSLPGSTRELCAQVQAAGSTMIDAPLGRTPSHALEGKLNIMAGGASEDFARARPILDLLGENVFHVGPIGAGHTLKLINNFYAQTTAMAMAESFAMADLAGIRRETLYEVMSSGPLKSGMMDFIKAYAVDGNPNQLAFSVTNARKDVGYYVGMADDFDVPSLMSASTKQVLTLAKAQGWGARMVPEMVDFFVALNAAKQTK